MRLLILFILIPFSISAQESGYYFHPDSAYRHQAGFSSEYFFSSSAIKSRFAYAFFINDFIDEDLKNSVSSELKDHNRFGSGFQAMFFYKQKTDSLFGLPNSFFSISLENHNHISSEFSSDAFEIYFRGNKSYAGKTADLGDFKYDQVYWQDINFTFGHEFTRNLHRFGFTLGLSLNKGERLFQIDAPRASLYTQEFGEWLDLDAAIEIYQNDSLANDFLSWNGTGGSFNGSFFWQDKKKNVLEVTVSHVGFIAWNKNSSFVNADTSFRFEGIDVSELFDFRDSVHTFISIDSSLVEPYLSSRIKKSKSIMLPSLMRLNYHYRLTERLDLEAEGRYHLFANALPGGSLRAGYNLGQKQRVGVSVSYGDYTDFNAGLSYQAWILQRWMLTLRSDYLSGFITDGKAQGTFVSLSAHF